MAREFNDRVSAQRAILRIINREPWQQEQLHGLSSGAIERWADFNDIKSRSKLVALVREAGEKLFFLANKSQDQVSSEYLMARDEVSRLAAAIAEEVRPV